MPPEAPQDPTRGLMTREQVAALLQVSPRSVSRWTKSGELASIKFDRAVRYDLRDVLAFVEKNRVDQ